MTVVPIPPTDPADRPMSRIDRALCLGALVLLPLMALPPYFIMTRLVGLPYALLSALFLLAGVRAWPRAIPAGWAGRIMHVSAIGVLAFTAISLLVMDPVTEVPFLLVRNVLLPAGFYLLGFALGQAGPLWCAGVILTYGLGNALVGIATVHLSPPITDYAAVQMSEMFAAGRMWLSPFSGQPEGATGLNSAAFGATFAFALIVSFRSLAWRALAAVAACASVYLALITETRGVLVAAGLAFLLVFIRSVVVTASWRNLLWLLLLVALAAGMLQVVELPERFRPDYWAARGLTGREEIWADRWANLGWEPFGLGQTQSLLLGFTCHSQVLELFWTFGLLAGLAYLSFSAVGLWLAAGAILRPRTPGVIVSLSVCWIALLAHSLGESHIFSSPQAYYLLFLLAGCLATAAAAPSARRQRAPDRAHNVRRAVASRPAPPVPVSG